MKSPVSRCRTPYMYPTTSHCYPGAGRGSWCGTEPGRWTKWPPGIEAEGFGSRAKGHPDWLDSPPGHVRTVFWEAVPASCGEKSAAPGQQLDRYLHQGTVSQDPRSWPNVTGHFTSPGEGANLKLTGLYKVFPVFPSGKLIASVTCSTGKRCRKCSWLVWSITELWASSK